jgi:hypothetical protein
MIRLSRTIRNTGVGALVRRSLTVRRTSWPWCLLSLPNLTYLFGGTDKGKHGYTEYYHRHFAARRFKRLVVVEIGVGGYESTVPSGSLRVWRDYFPRSLVIGVDIFPKQPQLGDRVRFVQANQSDASALHEVIVVGDGPPDVVIDDGSHIGSDIRTSFEFLFPRMSPGSLYVIEDLHTSYYASFGGDIPAPVSSGIGLARDLLDDVQSFDATFDRRPEWGRRPPTSRLARAVHVYPGIVFVERG